MFADEFLSRLGHSPTASSPTQQTPISESSIRKKRPVEDSSSSGTSPPKESDTLCVKAAALSSSRAPDGESSRKESTEVPKDPLEGSVPLAGTSFGEGSFTSRGPSLGSPISILCWTRFGTRKASSGCQRSRSKLATAMVSGCSRG